MSRHLARDRMTNTMGDANGFPGKGQARRVCYAAGHRLEQPVGMLNQIAFRPEAQYEKASGMPPCSGAEAFSRCSKILLPALEEIGAEVILTGMVELTGAPKHWDMTFVVRYRRATDLFELLQTETYKKAAVHRSAGLADSRLILMRFEAAGTLLGTGNWGTLK